MTNGHIRDRRPAGLLARAVVASAIGVAACTGTAQPGGGSASPASPTGAPASAHPSQRLQLIPTATAKASPTAAPEPVPDPAGRIAFGRVVANTSDYGAVVALWAIDPDGTDLVQLNRGGSGSPAWSPDGTRLAFTLRQPDGTYQIATMAGDGSDVRVLTTGLGADNAAWSPDGTWIAYGQQMAAFDDPAFRTTLWRMDADGSNPAPLGDQLAFDVEPSISPDGTEVVFSRLTFEGAAQRQEMRIRTIATGKERVIDVIAAEHPKWSPDGAWIIYDTSPSYGSGRPHDQIERIAADGTGRPIVLYPATDVTGGFKPSYSPDGASIVFGCFHQGGIMPIFNGKPRGEGLCVMRADGSGVHVVVDATAMENQFSWGITPS